MTKAAVSISTSPKQLKVCQHPAKFVLSCLQHMPDAVSIFGDHVVTGTTSCPGSSGRGSEVLTLMKFRATAGPYKSRPTEAPSRPNGGINIAAPQSDSMPPKTLTMETYRTFPRAINV